VTVDATPLSDVLGCHRIRGKGAKSRHQTDSRLPQSVCVRAVSNAAQTVVCRDEEAESRN
jgi:hypothetical protein